MGNGSTSEGAHNGELPSPEELIAQFFAEHSSDLLLSAVTNMVRGKSYVEPRKAEEEAWDIINEVYKIVMVKADDYDPTRRLLPWLLGFAANIIKQRRSKIAQLRRREETLFDDGEFYDRAAEGDLDDITGTAAVEAILALVPPKDRAIIRAITLERRSYEEVALRLGISVGSARVRHFRALKKLREEYERNKKVIYG